MATQITPAQREARKVLGGRITARRKELGISQEKLADRLTPPVHVMTLSTWENASAGISAPKLASVAKQLNTTADKLLEGLPNDVLFVEMVPSAKPGAKSAAKPSSKPSFKPTAKPVAKPASQMAARPASKPASKPVAKSVAKPAVAAGAAGAKPNMSAVSKPASKPASKPQPKPAVKAQAQTRPPAVAARPAARPAPRPATRPSAGSGTNRNGGGMNREFFNSSHMRGELYAALSAVARTGASRQELEALEQTLTGDALRPLYMIGGAPTEERVTSLWSALVTVATDKAPRTAAR
jgi:transcriptional regulator with XRE-family HTH domain